jgi:hypothetical protein
MHEVGRIAHPADPSFRGPTFTAEQRSTCWACAYANLQVLGQAVTATGTMANQQKLGGYLSANSFKAIVGDVRYAPNDEWAVPRVRQTQFQNIKGNGLEQLKRAGTEAILTRPDSPRVRFKLRSGERGEPLLFQPHPTLIRDNILQVAARHNILTMFLTARTLFSAGNADPHRLLRNSTC